MLMVTYREVQVNKRGGKSVQLQLNGQPLVLQIPLMLTWGVNERVDESSGRKSYDMALQFGDASESIIDFRLLCKTTGKIVKTLWR